jgi:hypothetical protein
VLGFSHGHVTTMQERAVCLKAHFNFGEHIGS